MENSKISVTHLKKNFGKLEVLIYENKYCN